MVPILPFWARLAIAARLLTGRAYAVRLPDDRWPGGPGFRLRRVEVLRVGR